MRTDIIRKVGKHSWKYTDETAEKVYLIAEADTSGGRLASCTKGGVSMVEHLKIKSHVPLGKFLEDFSRDFVQQLPHVERKMVFNASSFNCMTYAGLALQELQFDSESDGGIGSLFRSYFVYNPTILKEQAKWWVGFFGFEDRLFNERGPSLYREYAQVYSCPPRCPLPINALLHKAKWSSVENRKSVAHRIARAPWRCRRTTRSGRPTTPMKSASLPSSHAFRRITHSISRGRRA